MLVRGQILDGRWEVDCKIAEGGHGAIYRGIDRRGLEDEGVAIKVMKAEGAVELAAFKSEALLAQKFRHTNVVRVLDYGPNAADANVPPFLVMEWLEGKTLSRLIGRLEGDSICRLVEQVASALQQAHRNNLVHRDLKPLNIMLVHAGAEDERFVLLDFGIATKTDASKTLRNEAGKGLGTLVYMAPEQFRERCDPRSDIYSFGVILFEVLTGVVPFPFTGRTITAIPNFLRTLEETPPPRLRDLAPGLDVAPEIEALLHRCLAKRPDERPQSMKDVADAFLRDFQPERYVPQPPPPPPSTAEMSVYGSHERPASDADLTVAASDQVLADSDDVLAANRRNATAGSDLADPFPRVSDDPAMNTAIHADRSGSGLKLDSPEPISRLSLPDTGALNHERDGTQRDALPRPEVAQRAEQRLANAAATLTPNTELPTPTSRAGTGLQHMPDHAPDAAEQSLAAFSEFDDQFVFRDKHSGRRRRAAGAALGLAALLIAAVPLAQAVIIPTRVESLLAAGDHPAALACLESQNRMSMLLIDPAPLRRRIREAWFVRGCDLFEKDAKYADALQGFTALVEAYPKEAEAAAIRELAQKFAADHFEIVAAEVHKLQAAGNHAAAWDRLRAPDVSAAQQVIQDIAHGPAETASLADLQRHVRQLWLRHAATLPECEQVREYEGLRERASADERPRLEFRLHRARAVCLLGQNDAPRAIDEFTQALNADHQVDDALRRDIALQLAAARLKAAPMATDGETALDMFQAAVAGLRQLLHETPDLQAAREKLATAQLAWARQLYKNVPGNWSVAAARSSADAVCLLQAAQAIPALPAGERREIEQLLSEIHETACAQGNLHGLQGDREAENAVLKNGAIDDDANAAADKEYAISNWAFGVAILARPDQSPVIFLERSHVRYSGSRPDYEGTIQDLKKYLDRTNIPDGAGGADKLLRAKVLARIALIYSTAPPRFQNPQQALILAKQAFEIAPKSADVLFSLATTHAAMHQFSAALDYLIDAEQFDKDKTLAGKINDYRARYENEELRIDPRDNSETAEPAPCPPEHP